MIDRAILAKIRKCLALSKSANEHEAAAALAKARELMAEHGITDAQLAMSEIEEAEARCSRAAKPPLWETYLASAVHRALRVTSFIDGMGGRTFVGRGPSAEIASYAFAVLFRALKAQRSAYIAAHLKRCKPARKTLRADVFCEGWASAVLRKIVALMPESVTDPLIDQYLAEHHDLSPAASRAAKITTRVSGDYWRGRDAGSAMDLNVGVGGSAAPLALPA